MCGIFGFMDTQRQLTSKQRNRLLKSLAYESEERGTDASGIAYNHSSRLVIYKRPAAAHRVGFRLPDGVNAVLGHTRQTTQGCAEDNYNNHPFRGTAGGTRFAFAHNGIIWNDTILQKSEALRKTAIQTDSYVAVQLLEKANTLSFDSLKYMAEKTQGSFVYTVLDEYGGFWFVKGDNPLALYRFDDGLYIYASTEQILYRMLRRVGLQFKSNAKIKLNDGDMIHIAPNGQISHGTFTPCRYTSMWMARSREDEIRDEIFAHIRYMGMRESEIRLLLDAGYDAVDISEMMYDPELLHECLNEIQCMWQ